MVPEGGPFPSGILRVPPLSEAPAYPWTTCECHTVDRTCSDIGVSSMRSGGSTRDYDQMSFLLPRDKPSVSTLDNTHPPSIENVERSFAAIDVLPPGELLLVQLPYLLASRSKMKRKQGERDSVASSQQVRPTHPLSPQLIGMK